MNDCILVLNSGSSSIKFCLFVLGPDIRLWRRGIVEDVDTQVRFVVADQDANKLIEESATEEFNHPNALAQLLAWAESDSSFGSIVAVGHRVVHGGSHFAAPIIIDDAAIAALDTLVPLAPLHQPHNLAGIHSISEAAPGLAQVACFDTSFHQAQPPIARWFGLPRKLHDEGIVRYGFHGLSYEFIASKLPSVIGSTAEGRVVVAHLGNGASLCAMRERRSIFSTMGFTALDGLMMGTRCGSLDPGVVLHLLDEKRMSITQVTELLYNESGLLGVSGISNDMRTLLASKDPAAQFAIELFTYRIARELGAAAAALQGLDAVIFTGGIGENAAEIRARVCRSSAWLGIELDDAANSANAQRITVAGSKVSAWVIPTAEESVVALHTARLIQS